MIIYLSYSSKDQEIAQKITTKLEAAGHQIWKDKYFKKGDNFIQQIIDVLNDINIFIVIISESSLKSEWVMQELSSIALVDLSSKISRILPILVENCSLPQYLWNYKSFDLTTNFDLGMQEIIKELADKPSTEILTKSTKKRSYDSEITSLSESLRAGRLTLICGAGVSIGAGIPSWYDLLMILMESMMKKISNAQSISLENVNPNEFQQRYSPSALIIGKYLKSNLGNTFLLELREALYSNNPTSCEFIESIVELARPQRDGKSLESIITFNYDGLIEEQLKINNIQYKSISSEGIRINHNELPIYHVHGFLPRKEEIQIEEEVVFSEDTYHSQFIDPFSWSNLIQLIKLSQNTCLFLGMSFNDPNLRRLLDVARRKNPSRALNHFVIKKIPNSSDKNDTVDQLECFLEEQDANELGLNVIWVDSYSDIPIILNRIRNKN
ncbi:TIR domain-containing protein [Methanospirillum lacunae]|uniref:Molecular chaperone Tir n=1 Tax=Methanospirillum lacunae TaxID=668570 RepID=A0A2V2N105_9EURY|nr:TIR domain-containing protein [Methanospirillum lacunae]PWR69857.1 molecular chaperone Tir [Methanospirillum lacunae]